VIWRTAALAFGEVGIEKRPEAASFSDFVKRFQKWLDAERSDKSNTIHFYKDRIRQLLNFDKLKNASLDKIDEQMVAEYVQWRGSKTRQYALRKKKGFELVDTFEP
jgi:site-specific recombinase XerD